MKSVRGGWHWTRGLDIAALVLAVGAAAGAQAAGAVAGDQAVPGQARLPATAATGQAELWPYLVEPGDTLIGLSNRLLIEGADWRVLKAQNHIADPRRMRSGSTLMIPAALLIAQVLAAEVLHTQGDVWVQHPGAAERQPLAAGASLGTGDVVGTGTQSSLVIRFDDGSRVLLRPDSQLRLDRSIRRGTTERREFDLQLQSGGADTRVPVPPGSALRTQMQMRTPVVSLAVRGTEFRTRTTDDRTQLEVLDGRVAAASALIGAGFGTVATADGVAPGRVLLPAPEPAAVATRIERLPLELTWAPLPGAISYRAQVYDTPGEGRLRLDGQFAQPLARWPDDLPDGRYELRLRATDADGLEGHDARVEFSLKARPEPPLVIAPQAGARTVDETIGFRWARNPAAAHYHLQVADTPDFNPLRWERSDLVETELRLDLPIGTHYWRLASVRGADDQGPWGDAQTVTRLTPPPPPPAEPPQVAPDGVLLAWRQSPHAGTTYRVQVANDSGFSKLVADETVDQPSWLLRKPDPGTYYVRVRSIDAEGMVGAFGGAQQIDVPQGFAWWWLLPALLLLI
jgi:hypothetical protein